MTPNPCKIQILRKCHAGSPLIFFHPVPENSGFSVHSIGLHLYLYPSDLRSCVRRLEPLNILISPLLRLDLRSSRWSPDFSSQLRDS
jgi:hypothetical protein